MLGRLALATVVALSLIDVRVPAAQQPLALEDLLSVGLAGPPPTPLRWGASRRQIQQRYPELQAHPAFSGFRLQGRVSAQGCTFNVYLSGSRRSDQLEQIWIAYRTGPLADCRTHLQSTLEALYGRPSTLTSPPTQDSGSVTQSTYHSATACVTVKWEERGVDYGVSPLTVTLGDLHGGCG